ncbi:hypothetical protein PFLUV_G00218280 [Perca fluviatilis]|uniref:CEP170 C-terminal domain-containing protein n=1 Tax=Perca fluviatilis TaxID=8168 RepID=A0A6A5E3S0_PERFL|nr:hypothetical protein PFLUV_G00218280 [Perca fluviatilis]
MSAQSKVADWLVHSDVTMMRRRPTCEDVYSTKSDLAINTKNLKGHHHDDGTQSDSEDPDLKGRRSKSQRSLQSHQSVQSKSVRSESVQSESVQSESEASQPTVRSVLSAACQSVPSGPAPASPVAPERPLSQSPPQATETPKQAPPTPAPEHLTQQAFIIEFFDDNPRKKRSQSFTHNPAHGDSYSALKAKLERRKGGERPASVHGHAPATQQVTVPLKGPGHAATQRSSSLKREKTDGESASRSSSGVSIRPFGSVGKKSKLAQEFAAELLKDSGRHDSSPTRDNMSPPPMSAPPVMVSPPHAGIPSPPAPSSPHSPIQPPAITKSLTPSNAAVHTSPVHSPTLPLGIRAGDPKASPLAVRAGDPKASPLGIRSGDPKASPLGVMMRGEEDDSLSDAGTYTIETETQDREVEEARNMIDQVLFVQRFYRLIGRSSRRLVPQVQPAHAAGLEGPKWVSCWASLADGFAKPGSTPPHGECLEDLRFMNRSMGNFSYDTSEPESRTRRLLPQVPPEKLDPVPPSILIRQEPSRGRDHLDRVRAPHPQDGAQRLAVLDDVDPDSLSDASRSDDGSVLEKTKKNLSGISSLSPGATGPQSKVPDKLSPASKSSKSTCFYIGSDVDGPGKPDHHPARSPVQSERTKPPATTVLIRHLSGHEPRRTGVKPNSSAPNLRQQDGDSVPARDGCVSPIVRQESFTKDRPSDTVQMKKLPHISSQPSLRDMERRRDVPDSQSSLQRQDMPDMQPFQQRQDIPDKQSTLQRRDIPDMQSFQQDADGTLSSLDSAFPSSGSGRSSKKGGSSTHMDDSLSGESDVDTASTVSQVSGKNAPASSASKKRPAISGLQKEKSSSSPSIPEKGRQLSARERLSEKRRHHQTTTETSSKAEAAKRLQTRRSAGNRGSLDLSEGSAAHWNETASSDHEVSRPSNRSKKLIAPLQKEDNGKTPKTQNQQVLTRSNSLSAPRPTRASMLRRARLGEASDNEGAETDRGSQNSDAGQPRGSTEGKKLSRLDILAMPRKRTGSFTTPSDSEAPVTGRNAFSNRSSESAASGRKTSVGDGRQAASKGGGAPGKQTLTRTRSSGAKYPITSSRRRQKGSDFSSSSEEEYETKRSSHPSTSCQTPRHRTPGAARSKSVSVETEEDEDPSEVDPYQNWSTHSAEIAKLSQDLAKDLAILAKEIHDVAGDGDSPGTGVGAATSPGSLPNTPSTISAREELVQHIPEASLNFQKVPPGSAVVSDLDANMNEPEAASKQRRPWNRQEVILDNLMLNPVSQLSQAIRENTEQLAEKMKVLFQNKAEVWEEIEAKINAENEVPILKTSNKEITSILQELRRVQRQLEVINTIVEPGGVLQPAAVGTPSRGQTRTSSRDKKPAAKPRGAPATNANESTKRAPRGPDGAHYMA